MVEFTNTICEAVDEDFLTFEYCLLKSFNRTYKYLTIKVNLLQIPVTDIKVNMALYKRLSTYKPYFYNVTVDCCKFLKNVKLYPIANYVYDFFKEFSNINHSCPYDHDLLVDKLTSAHFNHRFSNVQAFPLGDYMFNVNWILHGHIRAKFRLYFTHKRIN
ncbi:uncharacterized protein LOC121530568 [Drosophila eugracilis]|uniref:uncharacterized protein LOC121530568 n=1 Tax=Drosophila eugracilis TaxID=29029 RepID=UPI001BDAA2EF|nr:uncharacterized protein LOC121530568 [Drosophila eugracilis]